MELNLGRIEDRDTFSFHEKFPVPIEDVGECDVEVEGTVVKTGGRYLLDAEIKCALRVQCSRCLEGFILPVETAFGLVFHRGESSGLPGDVEEDDFVVLTGDAEDRYDIFPRVREAVILELPIKFLCRVDCKGLCSRCGSNLNRGDCGCSREKRDPRWAPLKNLLREEDES